MGINVIEIAIGLWGAVLIEASVKTNMLNLVKKHLKAAWGIYFIILSVFVFSNSHIWEITAVLYKKWGYGVYITYLGLWGLTACLCWLFAGVIAREQQKTFFNEVIKSLESFIEELDDWLACVNKPPFSRCEELKHTLFDEIGFAFLPTNRKSKIAKSMKDYIDDILLFLKHCGSGLAGVIEVEYKNTVQQWHDTTYKCNDAFLLFDTKKLPLGAIFMLKSSMQHFVDVLRSCKDDIV
jgi:hypothetical protein